MSIYSISRRKKCLPTSPPCESSLKQKEIDKANYLVKKATEEDLFTKRGKYATYTSTARNKLENMLLKMGIQKLVDTFLGFGKEKFCEAF